eukprot:9065982-Alexandrium_andersonii.AAC.1
MGWNNHALTRPSGKHQLFGPKPSMGGRGLSSPNGPNGTLCGPEYSPNGPLRRSRSRKLGDPPFR